jgi:hypothetical protein
MHGVLTEIAFVMAVAVAAALLLRRLAVPPVVGFILAGVAIGPAGLGLVSDRDKIEIVAEVGVMLLLFMVGLKISLRDLWRMRATVLGGGGLQYGVTALATSLLARAFGLPWPEPRRRTVVHCARHLAARGPGRNLQPGRTNLGRGAALPGPGGHPRHARTAIVGRPGRFGARCGLHRRRVGGGGGRGHRRGPLRRAMAVRAHRRHRQP